MTLATAFIKMVTNQWIMNQKRFFYPSENYFLQMNKIIFVAEKINLHASIITVK
jgi:hypothetical protein